MILGLVLFVGVHALTTQRDLRARLIGIGGEAVYKIGYARARGRRHRADRPTASAHYRADGLIDVWHPPTWIKHITAALMLPAVDPGGRRLYPRPDLHHAEASDADRRQAVGGWRICSPMAISARSSCSARLLAWAVFDRISLKRRTDAGGPPIPVGGPSNDLIAIAVGIVAYLALAFAFHPVVIGVPVFGA